MDESKKQRFLGTQEIAEWLGVSNRTVTEWASQWFESGGMEGLPGFRVGKKIWRFDPVEVERWLEKQKKSDQVQKEVPKSLDTKNRNIA